MWPRARRLPAQSSACRDSAGDRRGRNTAARSESASNVPVSGAGSARSAPPIWPASRRTPTRSSRRASRARDHRSTHGCPLSWRCAEVLEISLADLVTEPAPRTRSMAERSMTYTHGHAESVLRSHRARTAANSAAYLLPYLGPTHRLLDVGSGPGTITADLADSCARSWHSRSPTTPPHSPGPSCEAQGVTNAEVRIGDVQALDLDDAGSTWCTPTRSSSTSPTRCVRCARWRG